MRVHHIGYLIDDIKKSAAEFGRLGFFPKSEIFLDSARQVYIQFLDNNGLTIELIQTASKESQFFGLRKKFRNTPYHVCYEVEDLNNAIKKLTASDNNESGGCVLLHPPQQAPAIEGIPNVAFILNRHIGIIELVEVVAKG